MSSTLGRSFVISAWTSEMAQAERVETLASGRRWSRSLAPLLGLLVGRRQRLLEKKRFLVPRLLSKASQHPYYVSLFDPECRPGSTPRFCLFILEKIAVFYHIIPTGYIYRMSIRIIIVGDTLPVDRQLVFNCAFRYNCMER